MTQRDGGKVGGERKRGRASERGRGQSRTHIRRGREVEGESMREREINRLSDQTEQSVRECKHVDITGSALR